ncbi:hypothetical protein F7Q99_31565 [Streptomyces kaniharaensis]|uniref:Uncharacterized protein n=1 Tax=Streptomyces kaniharaensis TaxID=212423 RepID=A0A6N7KWW0_9ACTN|nr:hypothetical protein [Streptomyces kaniharaensis]MQS14768.1 hypothetical protein [Streptomyces kaniharaensis]MQS16604.1 hypothetical protein [Streptomyces kaniharaensis]
MADDMEIERYRHETVELTVGELLEALSELPAEAPIRIDVPLSPRSGETRDSVDSGVSHFVVSGVVLHDADYLYRDEVVLQADFCSAWYVRPVTPRDEG